MKDDAVTDSDVKIGSQSSLEHQIPDYRQPVELLLIAGRQLLKQILQG